MDDLNREALENIKKLSVSERLYIVENIWNSIAASKEVIPLSDEQKKELDFRLESFFNNPCNMRSFEEAKKNIQSKI